jgi:MYXO-CTERM domain-containing protein
LYLGLDDGTWLDLEVEDKSWLFSDPTLSSGSYVRVYGDIHAERLHATRIEAVPRAPASTIGKVSQRIITGPERTLAVVLVGSNNSFDPGEMKQRVFGDGTSANAFFQENSFGYFRVVGVEDPAGDVFGPYNINLGGCNINGIANDADGAAESDGHDMSAYDHVMYYFPPNTDGCPGGGQGAQPGRETWIYGVGINAAWDYASHELGHNFGLFHAASYTGCQSPGGGCSHDEYGDPTDVMGGRNFQYSSYHKEKLAWLAPESIDVVSASKQVRIYPVEATSQGVQSVRVPRGDGDFIHLEYRQPIGFDERLEEGLTDGVLVRIGPDPDPEQRGNYARLFDMKPQTGAMTDAALAVGSSFEDGGLQVTTVEATSNWALVDIIIDGIDPPPIDDGGASGSGVGGTSTTGSMTTGAGGTTNATASITTTGAPPLTSSGVGGATGMGGSPGSAPTTSSSVTAAAVTTTGTAGITPTTTTGSAATGATAGATTGGVLGGPTTTGTGVGTLTSGGSPYPVGPFAADEGGCACATPGATNNPGPLAGSMALLLTLGASWRRRRSA